MFREKETLEFQNLGFHIKSQVLEVSEHRVSVIHHRVGKECTMTASLSTGEVDSSTAGQNQRLLRDLITSVP